MATRQTSSSAAPDLDSRAPVRRHETPRVLLVSHTYLAPVNRGKLRALAEHVALEVLVPERWHDALFTLEAGPETAAAYGWHSLPARWEGHVLRYYFPLAALNRLLRALRPELVYAEAEPASIVLAELAWLKRRHGFKLVAFTWENILRRSGLPGVEGFNLRRCDGLVAGNKEAEGVVRAKGYRGPVSRTPQLGVDASVFRPAEATELRSRLGLNSYVAGYLGRLVEAKGLRTILAAAERAPGWKWLIVGTGPLQADLEQWSASHPGRLHLVPAVPHAAVAEHMNTLDAFVLPSLTTARWKEQFGHTLIEAMACGVPVVGSDSGAIPEVIGEAGLIVPEGNAAALAAALHRLAAEPGFRARLGQTGRERVLACYTHERIAAANAAFFEQVLRA